MSSRPAWHTSRDLIKTTEKKRRGEWRRGRGGSREREGTGEGMPTERGRDFMSVQMLIAVTRDEVAVQT